MHYKQNTKESKTYVQGLRSFGNTLPRSIKKVLKKNGYNYSEIISKWNLLVGKEISSYCYPRSIKMSNVNKNGTLINFIPSKDVFSSINFSSTILQKRMRELAFLNKGLNIILSDKDRIN